MTFQSTSKSYLQPTKTITLLNGNVISSVDSNAFAGMYDMMRQTYNTPGFVFASHRMPVPMNQFGFAENDYKVSQGFRYLTLSFPGFSYEERVTGVTGSYPPAIREFSAPEIELIRSLVQQKALLKIKDQKVNIAQAFAERDQTVRLLTTTAKRLSDCIRALKRGDFVAAAKAVGLGPGQFTKIFNKRFRKYQSEAVSQGWLELQYGWRPLLADIYGAAEVLHKAFSEELPLTRVETKQHLERDVRETSGSGSLFVLDHYDLKADAKCVCYFTVTQQPLQSLASLGITNPIYLAWELLPFSFVADWFIPIGNFVSSFDATLGVKFSSGCITTFQKYSSKQYRVSNGPALGWTSWKEYTVSERSEVKNDRVVLVDFPSIQLPAFKDPLSLEHFANAAALLRLNFKR